MKITIITSFPFPNGKATANRMRVFAEELLKNKRIDSIDIVSYLSSSKLVNIIR